MKKFKDMTSLEKYDLNKNSVYPVVGDCAKCDGYIVEVISGPDWSQTLTIICNKCGTKVLPNELRKDE